MAIDRVLSGGSRGEQEEQFNSALRPQQLTECIGQSSVKEKLSIAIAAARHEPDIVPEPCPERDKWLTRAPFWTIMILVGVLRVCKRGRRVETSREPHVS